MQQVNISKIIHQLRWCGLKSVPISYYIVSLPRFFILFYFLTIYTGDVKLSKCQKCQIVKMSNWCQIVNSMKKTGILPGIWCRTLYPQRRWACLLPGCWDGELHWRGADSSCPDNPWAPLSNSRGARKIRCLINWCQNSLWAPVKEYLYHPPPPQQKSFDMWKGHN